MSVQKFPKNKWKKVKLCGNLISDDGGGLEGLIGLEVLEDCANLNIKKSTINRKRDLSVSSDISNHTVDETDISKKSNKKKKKVKISKLEENNNTENDFNHTPGMFVLVKPRNKTKTPKKTLPKVVDSTPTDNLDDTNGSIESKLKEWYGMGINPTILKALAEKRFYAPTQIQSLTIPAAIMGKRDILGAAETGSGKTLAFGIPVLNGILYLKEKQKQNGDEKNIFRQTKQISEDLENFDEDELLSPTKEDDSNDETNDDEQPANTGSPLYALILTPTRELAVQIRDHIKAVAQYTGIKIAAIFGGLAAVKQERLLKKCPEIIVATPGRLWELIQEGNPHLNKIDDLNFLIIDETDRMVEKGHFDELQLLLQRINNDVNKKSQRQNFVFSATLTMVHDIPEYLQKINKKKNYRFLKTTPGQKLQTLIDMLGISQPKIVDITQNTGTAQSLTECRINCEITHKDFYLYYFLQKHPGRTIVFCNSIDCVRRLAQLFSILECHVLPLHANMAQRQRLKNLERFRDNPNCVMIATDVAARGLDIPNVEHVIHYQVPRTSENYVHRSGRTARANKEGIAILIMEPAEVKNYIKLCNTLGRSEDLPIFPVSTEELKATKDRVLLAREIDKLSLKLKRTLSEIGWKEKIAEEADILLDEEDENSGIDSDTEESGIQRDKKLLKSKKTLLTKLLARPVFTGLNLRYPSNTINFENQQQTNLGGNKTAVNIMKNAIEEYKTDKQKRNSEKIFKRQKYSRL